MTRSYFFAKHQAADDQTNVTGNGASYTPTFTNELYNQGGDFDSSLSKYTAPVEGLYMFAANIILYDSGFTLSAEELRLTFTHSVYGALRQGSWADCDTVRIRSNNSPLLVYMAAAATLTLSILQTGAGSNGIDDVSTDQWFAGGLVKEFG